MTQYPLMQEGDLLVFEWLILLDPKQPLSISMGKHNRGILAALKFISLTIMISRR
jgi:hypothetical protein